MSTTYNANLGQLSPDQLRAVRKALTLGVASPELTKPEFVTAERALQTLDRLTVHAESVERISARALLDGPKAGLVVRTSAPPARGGIAPA